jgi:uracil-DNA glycosylase family 4
MPPGALPPGRASQRTSLETARRAIVDCERCPRLREYCLRIGREKRRAFRGDTYWSRPVPGFGDPSASMLLVGLAPAAHGANRTGRVFTGDGRGGSGDFLMSALHRAGFANLTTSDQVDDGLRLSGAFIAAAVRCAPPDNKPTPQEIANCRVHLRSEIDALPGIRVVVALGRIAFDGFVQMSESGAARSTPRPRFGHGALWRVAGGITLIGCYHPSRQNTHTGRLTPPMMDDVFRLARRELTAAGRSPEPSAPGESID